MIDGLRNRGIESVVDTTQVFELDLALHGVPETDLVAIVRNVLAVPLSHEDASVGAVQIRRIGAWEVAFAVSREDSAFVITLGMIGPAFERGQLEARLRQVEWLAIIRGATGL